VSAAISSSTPASSGTTRRGPVGDVGEGAVGRYEGASDPEDIEHLLLETAGS
jgi:hypothetical protein